MKRDSLYSSARRRAAPVEEKPAPVESKPAAPSPKLYKRHEKAVLLAAGAIVGVCMVSLNAAFQPAPPVLTQEDLDAAVARTLQSRPLPSPAIKAYQAVRDSIVRVRAIGDGEEHDENTQRATGSGVVVIDKGVILTNLHVVNGATRILVTFFTGLESEATIVSTQPENDLAVLQAREIPDDLRAATLRSARELIQGEHVTAVGFPFGIGPSVSAGVISGLGRQYRLPQGTQSMTNLIQFDASTNPGSSGGPLVNAAGEVIGIVTAILSTSGSYAGIAFAVPIESAASAAGLPPF
ncbi:MAG TPA: trypsin-like peptidase domain-containing protein [Burkholderiales bacterium]|nr:trypsin-like peptidase domain-containing protein [Burkholderiales bacterium]